MNDEIAQNESTFSLIEQFLTEAQTLENAILNKIQLKLLRSENLKKMLETSKKQIVKANDLVKENQTKMIQLEDSTDKITNAALEKRVKLALLEFKRANANRRHENYREIH